MRNQKLKFIVGRRPVIRANIIEQIRINNRVWGCTEILYYMIVC